MTYKIEGREIKNILNTKINNKWNGKECILELKDANYNWRQMEWIGWYLEFIGRKVFEDNYGGNIGPTYGRTTLDYKNNYIPASVVPDTNCPGDEGTIVMRKFINQNG